jgi:YidC/Oxa1 family membrane protein insertase
MEKRVLVAAILSAVVVIVWFAVLAPPPARERSGTTKETPTARVDSQGTEASPATAVAEMVGMAAAKAPRILGTEDREVVIEGEGVRALVAARGGVIRSLKLADYKDAKGKTRELVRVGDWAPLSLGEVGGWNTELYSVEEQAGGVVLRWSDGEGNWATKWVSASKLRYGLEVKVEAGGVPARAGVVVGVEMGSWRK